ncbi:MAG: PorP/SprF family type IX secretion system membrane protein [Flavisolibacter sp.]|nr:PorP/SprF family type IX secretion system membrane protein [Flavisolibacter sp.]
MKKYLIPFHLFFMISIVLRAQSYHFSQFFSTPLLTNPANTGDMDGPYRLSSNFRSQGKLNGGAYLTGYISADFSLFKNRLSEGHRAGVGVYVMNDQSLNGALQTNSVGLSVAYNVGLDENGEHNLAAGFQGVYHQRILDYNKLSFGNQFGSTGYDPSLPIGEPLDFTTRNYFDANAGLVYNALLEDRSFFAGVSVYNILKHKENFLPEKFAIPTRYVLQAGAQKFVGDYGKIYISLTNMSQAKAYETTIGGAYGIQLGNSEIKNELNFGMWYRLKDALIPYVGYYYNGFQVGLSFDYTVSSLKTAAQVRNGYELTLIYRAIDKRELKTLVPWY